MSWVDWLRFGLEKVNLNSLPHAQASRGAIDTIIQIAVVIVGALSVLFITIGGLRYILSQGDPQGVAKAKGTIMYALVGVVIAIVAQSIIIFVLGNV